MTSTKPLLTLCSVLLLVFSGQAVADDAGQIDLPAAHELEALKPVIVAVIDTGLDYFHPDLDPGRVWRNSKELPNGIDDDKNGYIDDLIGWDFVEHDNNPWDWTGHGTHVAGVIADLNQEVLIMPLRALNLIGNGRSSGLAQAIYYAVANGAQVINLSVAARGFSRSEGEAIRYASGQGVLVVVAAGNEAIDASGVGPAAYESVVTVAGVGQNNRRSSFSNHGAPIDIVAPAVEILSLRARRTDLMLTAGVDNYVAGASFSGPDARHYRASGTSFAVPFVSGAASLLFGSRPDLDASEVRRMLLHSATDIETPGRDHFTGYGLLNVRAALAADPDFFVEAAITGVGVARVDGRQVARVSGSFAADRLERAWLELGEGDQPTVWKPVSNELNERVSSGTLGDIAVAEFSGANSWTLRLVVEHENGSRREARYHLNLQ